jgi:hypothetical protein
MTEVYGDCLTGGPWQGHRYRVTCRAATCRQCSMREALLSVLRYTGVASDLSCASGANCTAVPYRDSDDTSGLVIRASCRAMPQSPGAFPILTSKLVLDLVQRADTPVWLAELLWWPCF